MISTNKLLSDHSSLSDDDQAWLAAFVREWHLLADMRFSDLVLWVRDTNESIFWAVAQRRPVTGPTALEDDVVGATIVDEPDSLVNKAFTSQQICGADADRFHGSIPVEVRAVPIVRDGETIAVVERFTNQMGIRIPGTMEDYYLEIADILTDMTWHGHYPIYPPSDPSRSPRVSDGLIYTHTNGIVQYASPNAMSAYRRLGMIGDLVGEDVREPELDGLHIGISVIAPDTGEVSFDRSPTTGLKMIKLDVPGEYDVENESGCVRIRVLQLCRHGTLVGSLVLCRDITELRNRERELMTKDATIREVHHRVKNNLQTVAALLRLQARRTHSAEAKDALTDAMNRVQSIAVVHEILSQNIDEAAEFDQLADKLLQRIGDVAASSGIARAKREGTFGLVPAKVATSLSLIMTELCQNAIEHGLASHSGSVTVRPLRNGAGDLILDVVDDGDGLPEGFQMGISNNLGTSIVATLAADLDGDFTLFNNTDGPGATSRLIVPAKTLEV